MITQTDGSSEEHCTLILHYLMVVKTFSVAYIMQFNVTLAMRNGH